MNNSKSLFVLITSLCLMFSCGKKEEAGSSTLISGTESKIWKATKETNAAGEKDKLTKEEKQQEIQFFANGSFTMKSKTEHQEGKWNYNPSQKALSLQFENAEHSENFQVLELDEDDMKLKAGDGSEMKLETD